MNLTKLSTEMFDASRQLERAGDAQAAEILFDAWLKLNITCRVQHPSVNRQSTIDLRTSAS